MIKNGVKQIITKIHIILLYQYSLLIFLSFLIFLHIFIFRNISILTDFENEVNKSVKDYFENVLEGVTNAEADILKNSNSEVLNSKASLKYVLAYFSEKYSAKKKL